MSDAGVIDETIALGEQWFDQFQFFLETSRYPQFRTMSAIGLLRSDDAQTVERGLAIIDEALDVPEPDEVSLWLVASECSSRSIGGWCEPGGVFDMLVHIAPDNIATRAMRLSQVSLKELQSIDAEEKLQLLTKLIDGDHYDVYFGRGADRLFEEALRFVEINPDPQFPDTSYFPVVAMDSRKHALALSLATAFIVSSPSTVGFTTLNVLCKPEDQNQSSGIIDACLKLAGIMQNSGYSHLTKRVGQSIERSILEVIEPDGPDLQARRLYEQVFQLTLQCYQPPWMTSLGTKPEADLVLVTDWMKNLSEHGEWQALRLSSIQEYNASPDAFAINPADCDEYLEMTAPEMADLLKGQTGLEAWQHIRRKAGTLP